MKRALTASVLALPLVASCLSGPISEDAEERIEAIVERSKEQARTVVKDAASGADDILWEAILGVLATLGGGGAIVGTSAAIVNRQRDKARSLRGEPTTTTNTNS